MDQTTFESIVEEQIARCVDTLLVKGAEYATDDRLHNLRVSAALERTTMEAALAGMLAKHTVSIFDMCTSKREFTLAQWNEKIGDHINYLLILAAIVRDENAPTA
jgi:hypothetical protein